MRNGKNPQFNMPVEPHALNEALPWRVQLIVAPDSRWLLLPIAAVGLGSLAGSYHGSVSVLLGGGVAVLAALATVKSPHMAIVALLLLYGIPSSATDLNGPLYRLNGPSCAFLMLLSVMVQAARRRRNISTYAWQPAALFVILILGMVTHQLRSSSYRDELYVCAAIALTGFSTIQSREQLNEVIFALWLLGVTMAVVSLGSAFKDQASAVLDADSASRYQVEGRDQNYFSYIGGVAVACALGALAEKRLAISRLLQYLMLGSCLVVFMGLGIQGSRSLVVAILAAAIVFAFVVRCRPSALLAFALLAAGVACVAIFTPFASVWIARFQEQSLNTGDGRTIFWQQALSVFSDSSLDMIFGYGWEGSGVTLGLSEGGDFRSTHNMFLALLLDSGLVGLGLMATFLGRLIWRLLFTNCVAPRFGLVLLAYCLAEAQFLEVQRLCLFWCMMCVVAAAAQPALDRTNFPPRRPSWPLRVMDAQIH